MRETFNIKKYIEICTVFIKKIWNLINDAPSFIQDLRKKYSIKVIVLTTLLIVILSIFANYCFYNFAQILAPYLAITKDPHSNEIIKIVYTIITVSVIIGMGFFREILKLVYLIMQKTGHTFSFLTALLMVFSIQAHSIGYLMDAKIVFITPDNYYLAVLYTNLVVNCIKLPLSIWVVLLIAHAFNKEIDIQKGVKIGFIYSLVSAFFLAVIPYFFLNSEYFSIESIKKIQYCTVMISYLILFWPVFKYPVYKKTKVYTYFSSKKEYLIFAIIVIGIIFSEILSIIRLKAAMSWIFFVLSAKDIPQIWKFYVTKESKYPKEELWMKLIYEVFMTITNFVGAVDSMKMGNIFKFSITFLTIMLYYYYAYNINERIVKWWNKNN